MTTHAVSADADATRVNLWKGREDSGGQFGGDVGIHLVMVGPRRSGCIDIEACT